MKLNTRCDFLCHEGFKNVYFVGVRNVEGENHPGHTVCSTEIFIVADLYLAMRTWVSNI